MKRLRKIASNFAGMYGTYSINDIKDFASNFQRFHKNVDFYSYFSDARINTDVKRTIDTLEKIKYAVKNGLGISESDADPSASSILDELCHIYSDWYIDEVFYAFYRKQNVVITDPFLIGIVDDAFPKALRMLDIAYVTYKYNEEIRKLV